MKKSKFAMNEWGVRIKMCCASCEWMDATRLQTKRRCTKRRKGVRPCDCCPKWVMSHKMMDVRKSEGKIKRREYQLFLLKIREQEMLEGKEDGRDVMELRAEFESQYGSVYLIDN